MRRVILLLGLSAGVVGPMVANAIDAFFTGVDALWPLAWGARQ